MKRWTILTTVIGLLALSGLASAAPSDEEREDTVFNFGYDEGLNVFIWNTSPANGPHDCGLENGALGTTYGVTEDGLVVVDDLTDGGTTVEFPARPPEEVGDEFDPATDPVAYSGAEGECGLSGGVVAGPNGQINHGQFMKLFNSLYDGKGRGCINRFLAKSDLGKGDQQVRVGDVDPEAPSIADGDTGSVDFTTVLADCERGKKDKENGSEAGPASKAEKKANKADKPRGKSADAPGKNK